MTGSEHSSGEGASTESPRSITKEIKNSEEHRIVVEGTDGLVRGHIDLRTNEVVVVDEAFRQVVIDAVARHLREAQQATRDDPWQAVNDQTAWSIRMDARRPPTPVERPRAATPPIRRSRSLQWESIRFWIESRKLASVGLVALLIFGPVILQGLGFMPSRFPTAEDNRRIGWTEASASQHIARDIFDRVNDERRARGAPPLVWHDGLAERAAAWSLHMISTGEFDHSTADFQAHPDFMGTGENIHAGSRSAGDAHVAWMESDGHRKAILNTDFDAIGIGIICRNDGRMWATQIFGVRQGRAGPRPPVPVGVEPIVRADPGPACGGRRGLFR